jgi:hypothetical protein
VLLSSQLPLIKVELAVKLPGVSDQESSSPKHGQKNYPFGAFILRYLLYLISAHSSILLSSLRTTRYRNPMFPRRATLVSGRLILLSPVLFYSGKATHRLNLRRSVQVEASFWTYDID